MTQALTAEDDCVTHATWPSLVATLPMAWATAQSTTAARPGIRQATIALPAGRLLGRKLRPLLKRVGNEEAFTGLHG